MRAGVVVGWLVVISTGLSLLTLAVLMWTWRRRRRRMRKAVALDLVEVITQPPRQMAELISQASDAELCELWNRSGQEIQQAHLPTTLSWYVTLRRSLLNELENRDPRAVESWLAAGPNSADLPTYLHRR